MSSTVLNLSPRNKGGREALRLAMEDSSIVDISLQLQQEAEDVLRGLDEWSSELLHNERWEELHEARNKTTALAAAASAGDISALDRLLEAGAIVVSEFDQHQLQTLMSQYRQQEAIHLLSTAEFIGFFKASVGHALEVAAETGNLLMLQRLLDAGTSNNAHRAIPAAARGGHLQIVDRLLEVCQAGNYPSSNLEDFGATLRSALQSAADLGKRNVISPLLRAGAEISEISIHEAIENGFIEILDDLLRAGANIERRGRYGAEDTPLQTAVKGGQKEAVAILLSRGADVNAPAHRTGGTAVQYSVAGGDFDMTKNLIDAGADVNAPPGSEWADGAVQAAVRNGNMLLFDLLMDAGAVVDSTGGERASLCIASEANSTQFVSRLLSILSLEDARRCASEALLAAVKNNHAEVVRQLLQVEPEVDATSRYRASALQIAAESGNLQIMAMLLAAKADVNLDRTEGHYGTALQHVSRWGDLESARSMLAAGAVVNVTGSTAPPLQLAIQHGHVPIFELLLAAGADIEATSYRGKTMSQAAEESGSAEMKEKVAAAIADADRRLGPREPVPFGRGTGTLCQACRSAPLTTLLNGWEGSGLHFLHPSLTALKESVDEKCPFCCFLWKRLAIESAFCVPQPSPVMFFRQPEPGMWTCQISEPFPDDVERPESLTAHFYYAVPPSEDDDGEEARRLSGFSNRVPVTEDTSSSQTYAQIKSWLVACDRHPICQSIEKQPFLPTRLVQVRFVDNDSPDGNCLNKPRVVITDSLQSPSARYIALSHRWPDNFPNAAKLTRDTLHEKMRELDVLKLPQSFNEVFEVVSNLNIDYVWIDSLCIVQDHAEDWVREASQMGQVYGNAYFTLAISLSINDQSQGLFRRGDPSEILSETFECESEDVIMVQGLVMKCQPNWEGLYKNSPLVSRGWCFQEREMSTRVVHYTEHQVLWECRTLKASEDLPNGITPSRFFEPDGRVLDQAGQASIDRIDEIWHHAVKDYSSRALTESGDKFPALAGMASIISSYKPDPSRYLAGIWENDFARGLAWASIPVGNNGFVTNERYPTYIAPTWSWASVTGPVDYEAVRVIKPEPARGTIRCRGRAVVTRFDDHGDNSSGDDQDDESSESTHSRSSGVDGDRPIFLLRVLDCLVQPSSFSSFGPVKNGVLRCTAGLVPAVVPYRSYFSSGHFGEIIRLNTMDDKYVGEMHFDVPEEENAGEKIRLVFCVLVVTGFGANTGLAIVPSGGQNKEYRRVGIIPAMDLSCFSDVEVKEITII